MNAVSVLLIVLGIWIFVNAINGNLTGVITGSKQFNTGLLQHGTTTQQPQASTANPTGTPQLSLV